MNTTTKYARAVTVLARYKTIFLCVFKIYRGMWAWIENKKGFRKTVGLDVS